MNNLPQDTTNRSIEALVRTHWGKLLACLIAQIGDFQLAEDSLQDGLESAFVHWQRDGPPNSPEAWLLQTARRKAIDRLRRAANFDTKKREYQYLLSLDQQDTYSEGNAEIPDERLQLVFTCCHPALDEKSQIALTLRTLGGLKVREIARAYLDSEDAMAQRLVRAKRKIKGAAIPYKIPGADDLQQRLNPVLNVIYLIFNEGYFSTYGASQIRSSLCEEALRLVAILNKLMPDEAEITGLYALLSLNHARLPARYDASNNLVSLENQDRNRWDQSQISVGIQLLDRAMEQSKPGAYQIQAAISALHCQATDHDNTQWQQIVLLYDALFEHTKNPVVKLNRAVAYSYATNSTQALICLDELEHDMRNYQPFYAAKADFLERSNQIEDAELAYRCAVELSSESETRAFLAKKLRQMLNR